MTTSYERVYMDVEDRTTNTITLDFGIAPEVGTSYRINILANMGSDPTPPAPSIDVVWNRVAIPFAELPTDVEEGTLAYTTLNGVTGYSTFEVNAWTVDLKSEAVEGATVISGFDYGIT